MTGATGFIGKAVQKSLNSHSVRLTSRTAPVGHSGEFFEKTISSRTNFLDCLTDIDVVIHTAARVHQMNDKSEDPLSACMEINCLGTLNLARQAAEAGVKRFVFLSSAKVNGEKTEPGVSFRFDDARMANDPYSISKAEAEAGLMAIAVSTELEIVIIRPPLVYGPGVKANFYSLMRASQKKIPLPLGGINNKRSFVALDNLVDLIKVCVDHPKAVNEVFLVSDDSDISTSELLKVMASSFGHKARLLNVRPALLKMAANVLRKRSIVDRLCDDFQVDIHHTKVALGWMPNTSMIEGVRQCAEHIKNAS